MTIKNALELNISISKLLSIAENTPYMLIDNLSAAIAKSIIEKFHLDEWLKITF